MGLPSAIILVLTVIFLSLNRSKMFQNFMPSWLGGNTPAPTDPIVAEATQEESISNQDETTPKVKPTGDATGVPTFTLNDEQEEKPMPSKDAIAPLSNTRSPAAPPPKSNLMPPPALPPLRKPQPPTLTPSLRAPTTGPLPNRGPPAHSQQRASATLGPPTSTTSSSRGKVLLSPGHSPMDWAALTRRSGPSLSGAPGGGFLRVTPSQLRAMTGRKGKPAWSSWQGKVYNLTPYLPFHPGGEPELMRAAGRDGTALFMEVHPWVNWENMLGACLVGVLVPEEMTSPLEEMD